MHFKRQKTKIAFTVNNKSCCMPLLLHQPLAPQMLSSISDIIKAATTGLASAQSMPQPAAQHNAQNCLVQLYHAEQ
jgi:hypothetical protein